MRKPHRQVIRPHAKVSAETGAPFIAELDQARFYADKLEEVKAIMLRMPMSERAKLIADTAKWVLGGCR